MALATLMLAHIISNIKLVLCNQLTQQFKATPCGRIASIASGCHSIAPEGFLDLRARKELAMRCAAARIYLMPEGLHPGLKMSALSLLLCVTDHNFSQRQLLL